MSCTTLRPSTDGQTGAAGSECVDHWFCNECWQFWEKNTSVFKLPGLFRTLLFKNDDYKQIAASIMSSQKQSSQPASSTAKPPLAQFASWVMPPSALPLLTEKVADKEPAQSDDSWLVPSPVVSPPGDRSALQAPPLATSTTSVQCTATKHQPLRSKELAAADFAQQSAASAVGAEEWPGLAAPKGGSFDFAAPSWLIPMPTVAKNAPEKEPLSGF